MAKKKTKKAADSIPAYTVTAPTRIGGQMWLPGIGPEKPELLVIAERPRREDLNSYQVWTNEGSASLMALAQESGVDVSRVRWSYAIKFMTVNGKPNAKEKKLAKPTVVQEILTSPCDNIMLLSTTAIQMILGTGYKVTSHRGAWFEHDDYPGKRFMLSYGPGYLAYKPEALPHVRHDWLMVGAIFTGLNPCSGRDECSWEVLDTAQKARHFVETELARPNREYALDCEWHGNNPLADPMWLRFVQLATSATTAVVFKLATEKGEGIYQTEEEVKTVWHDMHRLLTDPNTTIIGHNVIADGEYLMRYGVDIRDRVTYDTMLAENLINSEGPYGLTPNLTPKYTRLGRYDDEMNQYLKDRKELIENGYGYIPDRLIIPYAAFDVLATWQIRDAQLPFMVECGYMVARGKDSEIISLMGAQLEVQRLLYEVQGHGMRLDTDRISEIEAVYAYHMADILREIHDVVRDFTTADIAEVMEDILLRFRGTAHMVPEMSVFLDEEIGKLIVKLRNAVETHVSAGDPRQAWRDMGTIIRDTVKVLKKKAKALEHDELVDHWVDEGRAFLKDLRGAFDRLGGYHFNPNSVNQLAALLFDPNKVGATPIKATKSFDSMPWSKVVREPPERQAIIKPATDKQTLQLIQDTHPVVSKILDYRLLSTPHSSWLVAPAADAAPEDGTGLRGKVWTDLRLHPTYRQTTSTGRYATKPNVQNLSKRAEEATRQMLIDRGVPEDQLPHALRTIFIPDQDDHILIEADYVQAESFVLAGLSGDTTMWGALTTPGMDLHDLTGIRGFGLEQRYADGTPVVEADMLRLAAIDEKAYKKVLETLLYITQDGKTLTRKEFKSSLRVGAKNINFGIVYGRGASAIALQVKAETRSKRTLDDHTQEIGQMLDGWKVDTYPQAWAFMEECAARVESHGYVENPFGRRRVFAKTSDRSLQADYRRKAQNFPIQSTVADMMALSMIGLDEYRTRTGLPFRIWNQVHDALFVSCEPRYIDDVREMFQQTMAAVEIPLPNNRGTMTVPIDFEVMSRWGKDYDLAV